eukprot:m.9595 g.9595  ORF g.9595 m.9595 type:complete len:421 (+) comp2654_c0_seq1:173-1435(+)
MHLARAARFTLPFVEVVITQLRTVSTTPIPMAASRLKLIPADNKLPALTIDPEETTVLGRTRWTQIADLSLSKKIVDVSDDGGTNASLKVSIERTRPSVPPAVWQHGTQQWVRLSSDVHTVSLHVGDQLALRAEPLKHVYTVESADKDNGTASSTKHAVKRARLEGLHDGVMHGIDAMSRAVSAVAQAALPLTASSHEIKLDETVVFKGHCLKLRPNWGCGAVDPASSFGKEQQLLVRKSDVPVPASTKVASFDFDQTLVRESGRCGQLGATPKFVSVIPRLKALHSAGYRIAIFTNESCERYKNPGAFQRAVDVKMDRLDAFVRDCGVPMAVLCSIRGAKKGPDSPYRKPNAGMWTFHNEFCNGGVAVDAAQSFYVGDADGRPSAHGDGDKEFAVRAKIAFYNETDFFRKGQGPEGDAM